jgi:hypothetical protein
VSFSEEKEEESSMERQPVDQKVTIVSGLPRSGTSMMMRILEAGGIPPLTDGLRTPDEDNPRGYYELEEVKAITENSSWLERARGRAVKVVAPLLLRLPIGPDYKVIVMRRPLDEVLASQRKMLERRRQPPGPPDAEMRRALLTHLLDVEEGLRARPDLPALFVNYNRVITDPRAEVTRLAQFLGTTLAVAAMAEAVEAGLHHQRGAGNDLAPESSRH